MSNYSDKDAYIGRSVESLIEEIYQLRTSLIAVADAVCSVYDHRAEVRRVRKAANDLSRPYAIPEELLPDSNG